MAIAQYQRPENGLAAVRAIESKNRLDAYPFYAAVLGELELRCGHARVAACRCRNQLLFTSAARVLLALKNGNRFGATSTGIPVLGFHPLYPLCLRTWNVPKPRISIRSPWRKECSMLPKMVQTRFSAWDRLSFILSATLSIKSSRVMPWPLPESCTQTESFHRPAGVTPR